MKKIPFRIWSAPIALFALSCVSYGMMIGKQGLHMDDWTLFWFIHFLGPESFKNAFLVDRPLLGGLYALTAGLFGESPPAWLGFAIVTRWLSSLAVWLALIGLWPKKHFQAVSAALLFSVYPGFISFYVPVTYGHHFIFLALTFFSLAAMNWSLRTTRWFWPLYLLSLIMGGYAIFSMEYYFGMELLRPVFLWFILGERQADRRLYKRVLKYWAPYIILILTFVVWRIATPTPRGSITMLDNLLAKPIFTLVQTGKTALQDIFEAGLLAWGKTLNITEIAAYGNAAATKYLLLILGVAAFVILYLAVLRGRQHAHNPVGKIWQRPAVGLILLGGYALLLGGVPVWMTNLRLELVFPWDRFTLAMMLGSALLLLGLIQLLFQDRWPAILLVGFFAGLAAGMFYRINLSYTQDWLLQRDFFWQLALRAPGLQRGTTILTTDLPFTYSSGNSLTATLNWIYAPDDSALQLPYIFYEAGGIDLTKLSSEPYKIDAEIRSLTFHGSTAQAIIAVYRPPACLKIINPQVDQYLPNKPANFRELLPLSRVELIQTDATPPAQPPAQFFTNEPEKGWCTYYQKAQLAGQTGDWLRVSELADQAGALSKIFYRLNVYEALPFIEGYARSGRWRDARALSQNAHRVWKNMNQPLCKLWSGVQQEVQADHQELEAIRDLQIELKCPNQ
ncbi:hypothetical protein ACFLZW_02380 [Chloroflexota bacterium]